MSLRNALRSVPGVHEPELVRFRIISGVPCITEAPLMCSVFRQAVLSHAGVISGYYNIPAVLSGKGEYQTMRFMSHEHAYYLCELNLQNGSVTHVCIYIRGGIDSELLQLLVTVPVLRAYGIGKVRLEPDEEDPYECSKLLTHGKEWVSVTPFMLGRHPRIRRSEKHSQEDYDAALERELELQVRRELHVREFPDPELVEFDRGMGVQLGKNFLAWREFKRSRSGDAPGPAVNYGHGFRIVFRKPVRGPLVLGYGCHFGLGMFLPKRLLELYR